MDSFGNVVSATQSIERSFGAKVASSKLGFLYNGYMKGFKIENKRHPHYLRPGAVARSNAAPTILFSGGHPAAAIGSTGSERMVSGIFQTLVRLQYQTPFEAVSAPRLHCTPEGDVLIEADRFHHETLGLLKRDGFSVQALDAWSFSAGGLQLVTCDGGRFCGVGEPRRDGAAAGPD
jgi:gamma-glutamyltranspeptidase/glutathione hydrolase